MEFRKSTRQGKKYDVFYKDRWISFGDKGYEQFRDSTPLKIYSNLDHGDPIRRKSYLARAKGIKNKQGNLTWKDKNSANYYSVHYLW